MRMVGWMGAGGDESAWLALLQMGAINLVTGEPDRRVDLDGDLDVAPADFDLWDVACRQARQKPTGNPAAVSAIRARVRCGWGTGHVAEEVQGKHSWTSTMTQDTFGQNTHLQTGREGTKGLMAGTLVHTHDKATCSPSSDRCTFEECDNGRVACVTSCER